MIALSCLAVTSTLAKSDLSSKQAEKLIANMAGLKLKKSAVHIKTIRPVDASTFEANAEIATAFRLEQNGPGQWRVAEFRTGQDQWQDIELISHALKIVAGANSCDVPEPRAGGNAIAEPGPMRARCLLADLLAVQLPTDAVRIKAVSSMTLPFSSKASAMVEALVAADFRFQKGSDGSWRVAAVKTGKRDWVDPEIILSAVNREKAAGARTELESIAKALEDFRGQRGFYVESKSEAVLIDFLSPRYLSRVIRLDPWRRPYLYEGTRDHFTLSSSGPDGKANTSDDIVLNGPIRSAASQHIPN